jgi:signal transduction histidine kinase
LRRLSLANQYLIASFLVLIVTTVGMGMWVGAQIANGVLDRTAGITALYVDSIIAPSLQSLATSSRLSPNDVASLDRLLTTTDLGQRIVTFKVWTLDGTVLYSDDQRLVGRKFSLDGGLAQAVQGDVSAELSDLNDPENALERERFTRLLQVYVPVRERSTGRVLCVAEFYQLPDDLDNAIAGARLRSWGVVIAAALLTYVLLASIVKRGSDVIEQQKTDLRDKVSALTTLLTQNAHLRERIHQAASRATAINEQALRRIGGDLHDGPGQSLALALLRLDAVQVRVARSKPIAEDFDVVKHAVEEALRETRQISAGLRLPELAPLSVADVVERVVRTHTRLTGAPVIVQIGALPDDVPLAVKIALFRSLQETLSNSVRHARGIGVTADVVGESGFLNLVVSDHGPGFDPKQVGTDGHLGLAGMREQVELLGGDFSISSAAGRGTTIRARWPLG